MRHLIDKNGTTEPNVTLDAVASRLEAGVFFWLDIELPDAGDIALLRDVVKLHPLALEDVERFGQRPKIEDYEGFSQLVVFGAATNADTTSPALIDPVEVHCYYAEHYLVTVQQGQCGVLADLREQHAKRLTKVEEGPGILYLVVDALVDSFFPEMASLDERIDELETTIFSNPTDDELQEVFTMKRQLVTLRQIVTPQRDMFAALVAGRYDLPGLDAEGTRYFRDVYDHLIRLSDELDTYRDLLTGAMDVYLSTVSNKLNVVMKQLGVIATIFLPISFLTGFFGQNFAFLTGTIQTPTWSFFVLGIGLDLLSVAGFMVFFKKRGWF
ncbi:MAG: magnesium/cobalt transporter CorA [Gaiellaceae bacterium]